MNLKVPNSVRDIFTKGMCMALAYEIHVLTDWRLAVAYEGTLNLHLTPEEYSYTFDGYKFHAVCLDNEDNVIDINGSMPLAEFRSRCTVSNFYIFKDLQEFLWEMDHCESTEMWDDRHDLAYEWAVKVVDSV